VKKRREKDYLPVSGGEGGERGGGTFFFKRGWGEERKKQEKRARCPVVKKGKGKLNISNYGWGEGESVQEERDYPMPFQKKREGSSDKSVIGLGGG